MIGILNDIQAQLISDRILTLEDKMRIENRVTKGFGGEQKSYVELLEVGKLPGERIEYLLVLKRK